MATVIIAKNQTVGALPLDDLPIPGNSLPASPAAVTLTDYATVAEIQNDVQLAAYVAVSDVVLNVDGTDLTSGEAGNALSTVVSTSTPTITTETSTAGGASNAGKVLELDANGKADGLVVGDAITHMASTANPHNVTAVQAGASALGHTHVESDITDLTHTDVNAIHDNVAGEISVLTEKLAPVAGDWILIEDSAAANAKKKVQVGNLPGGGASTAYLLLTFEGAGEYEVGTQVGGQRYNRTGQTWTIVDVTLHREFAGSSGSTTIDINIDGTTAYTTQGNRPTVVYTEGDDAVDQGVAAPDVTSVPSGSYLTLDIDAVEDDGENLTVVVTLSY